MKSSFELAMERLGGINKVSDEKKKKIAEIESKFRAKIAQIEISAEKKMKSETVPDEMEKIRSLLASEIASLKEKCENEKEKIRQQG